MAHSWWLSLLEDVGHRAKALKLHSLIPLPTSALLPECQDSCLFAT